MLLKEAKKPSSSGPVIPTADGKAAAVSSAVPTKLLKSNAKVTNAAAVPIVKRRKVDGNNAREEADEQDLAKDVGFQLLRATSLGLRMRNRVNYNEEKNMERSNCSSQSCDSSAMNAPVAKDIGEGFCFQFEDAEDGGSVQDGGDDDDEYSMESDHLDYNSGSCSSSASSSENDENDDGGNTFYEPSVPIKPKPYVGPYQPPILTPKKNFSRLSDRL